MAPSRWKQILRKLSLRRRRPNLPPGPCPIPILGNARRVGSVNPHLVFHSLSLEHGPLVLLYMGSTRTVVVSSSSLAKLFLTTHDHAFASRPSTASGRLLNYNRTDIGWAPYGPYWLQTRKICARDLLSAPRLESFQRARTDETRALTRDLFRSAASGQAADIRKRLEAATLNMLCRMVYGKPSDAEFAEMMGEFFKLNGKTVLADIVPWAGFLDLQGNLKKMKRVSKKCDVFWEGVLKEHEERRQQKPEGPEDLIDVLLMLMEHQSLEVKLERDGVKAFAQDIIAAGMGSCSATVEWALAELLRHPHMLDKAVEEVDSVIGNSRWVEEGDIPQLPYLASIVKEAMRLHPIAPVLIPHLSREHRNIDGYDIPSGTQIFINIYTIMRDPEIWESPMEFRPERFLEKPTDVTGEDHGLLPFGTGSRMCPGHVLGLRMVQLMLANVLHGFRWRLPEGVKAEDVSMEEAFGLATVMKTPLEAVAEPRLPAEMYGD